MTHKEKFEALLAEMGLVPKVMGNSVVMSVEDHKVTGFGYFFCSFDFAEDGSLSEVVIAE